MKRITVQFLSYKKDYPWFWRSRVRLVHNPVFPPDNRSRAVKREKLILSIGRLAAQKRFDLLIQACSIVFERIRGWKLEIIGNGPLHDDLQRLILDHGMKDRILLRDVEKDVQKDLLRASFYCQPSQWDGFPNAQAEAMAMGVVPIGFSSTAGVADMIRDGLDGYLCKGPVTAEALAGIIETAIQEKELWKQYSSSAKDIVVRYSVASWKNCWDQVLNEVGTTG